MGGSFPGVKRPELEADQLPQSTILRIIRDILYSPIRFHGVYRDNFGVNHNIDHPQFVLLNFLQLVTIRAR